MSSKIWMLNELGNVLCDDVYWFFLRVKVDDNYANGFGKLENMFCENAFRRKTRHMAETRLMARCYPDGYDIKCVETT